MLSITLRTDKPEAEIGLYEDGHELDYRTWQAHRQLAETIHLKIKELLDENRKELADVKGFVLFKGPGSFTGLRIGAAVANVLAESLPAAIIGANGDDWRENGLQKLQNGENQRLVVPEYGAPVRITQPKK